MTDTVKKGKESQRCGEGRPEVQGDKTRQPADKERDREREVDTVDTMRCMDVCNRQDGQTNRWADTGDRQMRVMEMTDREDRRTGGACR